MNATSRTKKKRAKKNRKKKKRNLRRRSDAGVHARLVDTVAHPRWRRLDAHRKTRPRRRISHTSAVAETHRGLRTEESQLLSFAHAQSTANVVGRKSSVSLDAASNALRSGPQGLGKGDETSATAVNEGGGPPRHRQSGDVERRVVPGLVAAVQTRGVSLFFLSYYTMINYYYPDYYYHYTMIIITTLRITIHLIMTITITTS